MQMPPRAFVEIDLDARDPITGTRLLRYKTTRYLPHQQRAEIRFLYDRFPDGDRADRYVSDFACHVYYPREVELLFRITGFRVEAWFGDYAMRPLRTDQSPADRRGAQAGLLSDRCPCRLHQVSAPIQSSGVENGNRAADSSGSTRPRAADHAVVTTIAVQGLAPMRR